MSIGSASNFRAISTGYNRRSRQMRCHMTVSRLYCNTWSDAGWHSLRSG